MSQMINFKQMSTTIPNDLFDRFNQMYTGCRAVFLRMAIIRAINDKQFFQDVFFDESSRKTYEESILAIQKKPRF